MRSTSKVVVVVVCDVAIAGLMNHMSAQTGHGEHDERRKGDLTLRRMDVKKFTSSFEWAVVRGVLRVLQGTFEDQTPSEENVSRLPHRIRWVSEPFSMKLSQLLQELFQAGTSCIQLLLQLRQRSPDLRGRFLLPNTRNSAATNPVYHWRTYDWGRGSH